MAAQAQNYDANVRSADDCQPDRAALADLQTSHVGYYPPDDPEYRGLAAIFGETFPEAVRLRCRWKFRREITQGSFVRVVFGRGPAAAAGLRRGDRVVSADGAPFHPVRSARGRADRAVALEVEREAGKPPITIAIIPRWTSVRDEWLIHQSPLHRSRLQYFFPRYVTKPNAIEGNSATAHGGRVIRHRGVDIAYIPLFAVHGDEVTELLRNTLSTHPFAACSALVLDLRDGWGGANPDLMNVFTKNRRRSPTFAATAIGDHRPQWRKPLVASSNGGSRSAGSHRLRQRSTGGTLVGSPRAVVADR